MREYSVLPHAKFLKDVETHQINVIRDDGLYRHIRFNRPGTRCYLFDLITWPGYLCITGDVETWVFARIPDMFEFFEGNSSEQHPINPQYWGEKLQGTKNFEEFSWEKFKAVIGDYFNSFCEDRSLSKKAKKELWEEIKEEVLDTDNPHKAQENAYNFVFNTSAGKFTFRDFFEYDLKGYTLHYLWGCYAIVWGIKKYREHKQSNQS